MKLPNYDKTHQVKCDSCGGVARHMNDAQTRRRGWTATSEDKHFCGKDACQLEGRKAHASAPVAADPLAAISTVFDAHKEEFGRLFKVPLATYWDEAVGFDVPRFDEDMVQAIDVKLTIAVRKKYGLEASRLVSALLAAEKRAMDVSTKTFYNALNH